MNILQSILYGLVSGLAAFFPISLPGHQSLMNLLFGVSSPEPVRSLLIHISIILAVWFSSNPYLERLRREMNRSPRARGKRRHEVSQYSYDLRLMKAGIIPMAICFVIIKLLNVQTDSFAVLAVFLFLNGLLIYITEHIAHGNKDSRMLSAFDSVMVGVNSALCGFPGISRIGTAMSWLLIRGTDRSKAFHWVLILSIPVCIMLVFFDLIGLFTAGMGAFSFLILLGYLLSAICSFGAALGSIYLMRFLSVNSGYSVFAFYSWGAAFLSFILYLNA